MKTLENVVVMKMAAVHKHMRNLQRMASKKNQEIMNSKM